MHERTFCSPHVSSGVRNNDPELLRRRAGELEAILRSLSDESARRVLERHIGELNAMADELEKKTKH